MVKTLELSNRYRATWGEFVRATNALQDTLAATAPDRAHAETAVFEAEKARLTYNAARDLLVAQMAGLRAAANAPSPTPPLDGKVRAIAFLLWEIAGKPDGTALADWLHAERLVKSASAAIAQ
ncbi:MAG TPA: DUF2934 domain-containing protein [Bryobacteraceae bacterium]